MKKDLLSIRNIAAKELDAVKCLTEDGKVKLTPRQQVHAVSAVKELAEYLMQLTEDICPTCFNYYELTKSEGHTGTAQLTVTRKTCSKGCFTSLDKSIAPPVNVCRFYPNL